MAESTRRLALRVALKLFSLIALLFLAYVLLNMGEEQQPSSRPLPATTLQLSSIPRDKAQRIEWQGGPLQLLMIKGGLYLFYDRGGSLNCPLVWQPPGTPNAPEASWAGGFRDQCSNTWYRYSGEVLPGQTSTNNLQSPPYRISGDLLEIGTNGDNAAPRTTTGELR